MNSQIRKNKSKTFFYLLYKGLSGDYFFYFAIDTMYLSQVKLMSFSSISLLITVFALCYIVVSIPMVHIVKWLGTSNASRIGTLMFLISVVMLFFDPWVIFVSRFFYATGISMKQIAEPKILKDNLKMYGLGDNYARYNSYSKFVYSIVDAATCIAAGFLFNVYVYAPIIMCGAILLITFVMSLFVKNEKEAYKKEHFIEHSSSAHKHEYLHLFKYHTTWLLLFFAALFFGLIACGTDINKMVFQEIGFSSLTIAIAACLIRVVKALGSLGFGPIYKKLKFSSIYLVIAIISVGMLAIGLGGLFLEGTTALVIIGIGSALLYTSLDWFDLIRVDFVMNSQGLTKRQSLLSITNIGMYGGRLVISLALSGILSTQLASTANLILVGCIIPFALIISLFLSRKRKINKY